MEKDSRTRLLEAAIPLFAGKGFAGVSIRDVAKAAGVNSALVSYYFGGKEGLYREILESHFSHIVQKVMTAIGQEADPAARIERLVLTIVAVHHELPFLLSFLHSELTTPTACLEGVVKKHIEQLYLFITRNISEGIALGQFRSDLNPGYAAVTLSGMINFFFIVKPLARQFLPPNEDLDGEYCMQAVNIYLNGVRGHIHE